MKKVSERVYAIHFFVNMSSTGVMGNSLIMLVTPFEKIRDLVALIEDKMYLSVAGRYQDNNLVITLGKGEGVSLTYKKDDLTSGLIFISSTPLREDIWKLDKDTQNKIINKLKFQESSKMLDSFGNKKTDLSRLDLILEKYTTPEKNLNTNLFVQISDIYHVSSSIYN